MRAVGRRSALCRHRVWFHAAWIDGSPRHTGRVRGSSYRDLFACLCVCAGVGHRPTSVLDSTSGQLPLTASLAWTDIPRGGVFVGGASALYMAHHAFGGLISQLGFACLALAWLYT